MTTLATARAAYGVVQLAAPDVLAGQRLDRRARQVTRVLGARQLAQACLSGSAPTPAVLALGAEIDALHAASMICLAMLSKRWRPAALGSAAAAAGFAAGGLATQRARRRTTGQAAGSQALQLRDRWADQLARCLVPGYARAQ